MQAYLAVVNAMANNTNPIIVPCHHVIKSDGSIGGYALGVNKKINLLINEEIMIKKGQVLDFEKYIYSFE